MGLMEQLKASWQRLKERIGFEAPQPAPRTLSQGEREVARQLNERLKDELLKKEVEMELKKEAEKAALEKAAEEQAAVQVEKQVARGLSRGVAKRGAAWLGGVVAIGSIVIWGPLDNDAAQIAIRKGDKDLALPKPENIDNLGPPSTAGNPGQVTTGQPLRGNVNANLNPPGATGGTTNREKKGRSYRLDYVEVSRTYNVRNSDEPKPLTPTKVEVIKGRPGNLEIALSTYWYSHRVGLTVNAPETVTEGEEVTVTQEAVSTFELKEAGYEEPYLKMGLMNRWDPAGTKTIPVSGKNPLNTGTHSLKVSVTRSERVGRDSLFWTESVKGVPSAMFKAHVRSSLRNQLCLETLWVYRLDPGADASR